MGENEALQNQHDLSVEFICRFLRQVFYALHGGGGSIGIGPAGPRIVTTAMGSVLSRGHGKANRFAGSLRIFCMTERGSYPLSGGRGRKGTLWQYGCGGR